MDKTIEDLKWFYEKLKRAGKIAEFYEAQANIILRALEKQIPKKAVLNSNLSMKKLPNIDYTIV